MSTQLPPRPIDATLSVTKAARLLGVHPNTVRTWSDAGRLRYYRINPRGDRRYRLSDLQRFLATHVGGDGDVLEADEGRRPGHHRGVPAHPIRPAVHAVGPGRPSPAHATAGAGLDDAADAGISATSEEDLALIALIGLLGEL